MIDILYELMDQNLIDSEGERAGRVDDIVVEDVLDRPPRVVALLSGGGAKSGQFLGGLLHRLTLWLLARAGLPQPIEPVAIPWEAVDRVDKDVILKRRADEFGLNRLNRIVAERLIGRIPGANK